jgi:hypothetical protein
VLTTGETAGWAELALDGLQHLSDDRITFVHGTTSEYGLGPGDRIETLGNGEYGRGFYTFLACGDQGTLGVLRAREWARLKTTSRHRPVLVYVSIGVDEFFRMGKLRITLDKLDLFYQALHPNNVANRDVVIGPVTKMGTTGREPKWGRPQPLQYKFEESGVVRLQIGKVEDV